MALDQKGSYQMASNITLSAGVRQNLLSLQNTAQLMSMTQNRLATGKKVNSALDNPTNCFTSSALQSRAGDLNSLLDSMSNGIKTLEAADNGLKAITKTVESMQSTLRQARQDKSFKTESYSVNLGSSPAGTEQISFSGGAVGSTAINVALTTTSGGTAATNAVAAGSSALGSISTQGTPNTQAALSGTSALATIDLSDDPATNAVLSGTSPFAGYDASGGDVTFDINGVTVTLLDNGGFDNDGVYSAQDVVDAINGTAGIDVVASIGDDGELVLTSTGTAGLADEIEVDNFTGGLAAGDLGLTTTTAAGTDAVPTADFTFDVNSVTVTLDGGSSYSAQDIVDAINNTVGITVQASIGDDGELVLTSTGTAGAADEVTLDNFTGGTAADLGLTGTTASGADGDAAAALTFDVNGEEVSLAAGGTYTAAQIRDAINTQVGTSAGVQASLDTDGNLVVTSTGVAGASDAVTIDNFSSGDATQLGFAGASASATGADASGGTTVAKTVDALVTEINGNEDLKGLIRASNDNGKLRIENLSTSDLTVGGVSTSGVVDGGSSTASIGGNDVRKNLVKQFNELRDQLDKLADDASFNGINLLRGDKLKLTFNETGTSTIEIQAKKTNGDETAVNSAELGITTVSDAQFDSDDSIDGLLAGLGQSLNTLRSQASSFGSNLSVVQNRTEFTKSMMNTLQTGADALVLADTNEEAANMLALQTRQQLSSTALSLASQADQAVLRLF
jgi:flagellin